MLLARPSSAASGRLKPQNKAQMPGAALLCLGSSSVWVLPAARYLLGVAARGPAKALNLTARCAQTRPFSLTGSEKY